MYHHMAEPCGTTQATRDDVRVTRVGRFLRRSSLDELPQLLNVLKRRDVARRARARMRRTRARPAGCLPIWCRFTTNAIAFGQALPVGRK